MTLPNSHNARYFLKASWGSWTEVTIQQFANAERSAGFTSKLGGLATGGFDTGSIKGRILYLNLVEPEDYAWDPEFVSLVWPETTEEETAKWAQRCFRVTLSGTVFTEVDILADNENQARCLAEEWVQGKKYFDEETDFEFDPDGWFATGVEMI